MQKKTITHRHEIGTVGGNIMRLNLPSPDEIVIDDIAHALSHICRFGGHTEKFFSVAQHSILVADHVMRRGASPSIALQALLHDASEAYTGDVSRPLKLVLGEPFEMVEKRLMQAILHRFEAPPLPLYPVVKEVDDLMLAVEKRLFQPAGPNWEAWNLPYEEAKDIYIEPLHPQFARHEFLKMFFAIKARCRKEGNPCKNSKTCDKSLSTSPASS